MKKILKTALICASLSASSPIQISLAQENDAFTVVGSLEIPGEAINTTKKFLELVKAENITLEMLKEVFQPKAYLGGKDQRLRRILSFLKMDIVVEKTVTLNVRAGEKYVVSLKNRTGKSVEASLTMPKEEGFLVGEFGFQIVRTPTEPPKKNLSDMQIIDTFDAYIEERAARDEFSGTVIIAKNGMPFYKTFLGKADFESGKPMTMDTPINLGSANKMWTGLAIGQLVESGLINWNDPVGKFLPNFPNKNVREKVTIHQLLNHTSGLADLFNSKYMKIRKNSLDVEDLLMTFADDSLLFEPGSRFEYSNAGPIVLGRIIEVTSGEDYYDYIQVNILDKAGMSNSGFFTPTETASKKAVGYERKMSNDGHAMATGPRTSNIDFLGSRGSPAGGAYASANDMLKFSNALSQNKIVSADTLNLITTPHTTGSNYGYLFDIRETNRHRTIGHNGGAPGINTDFNFFPDLGFTTIVLSNFGGAATIVSDHLLSLIAFGETANKYEKH